MRLTADKLTFRYRSSNREILSEVDFSLESDERVGMTAPSGFGKTTLCKILSGYETPDSGHVLLDGRPLMDYKGYCPVQMIWQHPETAVNPRLKMKEVLAEGDHIASEVIDGLGIEAEWLNRYPGELSGGELQRFAIARALGERTQFLLADEISAMLDLITQSQIWNFLVKESMRRKIGILAVSHSPGLLGCISTRVVDLREIAGK